MVKYVILSLLIILGFSGCGCKQEELEAYRVTHPYYKDVKVPVKCVVPKTDCSIDRNATRVEVVYELLECILEMKKAEKVCQ